jgi:adenine deaminase
MGFLKGFGLKQGALGSTMSWDSPDLIVLGCDPVSVKTAIARLKETGGGVVHAIGGEIYKWKELETRVTGLKLSEMFEKEKLASKVRDVMTKDV